MPAIDLIATVPFLVAALASMALVISIRAVPVVRVVEVVRVVVPRAPSRARRR